MTLSGAGKQWHVPCKSARTRHARVYAHLGLLVPPRAPAPPPPPPSPTPTHLGDHACKGVQVALAAQDAVDQHCRGHVLVRGVRREAHQVALHQLVRLRVDRSSRGGARQALGAGAASCCCGSVTACGIPGSTRLHSNCQDAGQGRLTPSQRPNPPAWRVATAKRSAWAAQRRVLCEWTRLARLAATSPRCCLLLRLLAARPARASRKLQP